MLCREPSGVAATFPSHNHANHRRGFCCGATRPSPASPRRTSREYRRSAPCGIKQRVSVSVWGNAGDGTKIPSADQASCRVQAARGGHRQAGLLRWRRATRRMRRRGPLLYRSPQLTSSDDLAQNAPARRRASWRIARKNRSRAYDEADRLAVSRRSRRACKRTRRPRRRSDPLPSPDLVQRTRPLLFGCPQSTRSKAGPSGGVVRRP